MMIFALGACLLALVSATVLEEVTVKPREHARAWSGPDSPFANTPLDDYVNKPDSNYKWVDTGMRIHGRSYVHLGQTWTGYVLNMTSQQWMTINESDRPIWFHILVVVVPDDHKKLVRPDLGVLWITGGDNENGGGIPKATDEDMIVISEIALGAGSIGAALFQVPNQHIVFKADPIQKKRSEDAIIAFGWKWFHDHVDQQGPSGVGEWLLRLPMTKAAVRAMDTMDAWAKNWTGQGRGLTEFCVAGASKRGWTTWTTAAVDTRVSLAIPIVLDELNFVKNIHHHYKAYGGWSFALEDYYEMNFTQNLDDPQTQMIMDIVDPIVYSERLTMPKLVCNAGGDEFFLPDDTTFWWDQMSDPKQFLMIPNAEHSMATGILELLPAAGQWAMSYYDKKQVPTISWTIDSVTGDITGKSKVKPSSVHMWHATSCKHDNRRDFRLLNLDNPCKCGISVSGMCVNLEVLYTAVLLNGTVDPKDGMYTYVGHRDEVPGQWVSMFLDFIFDPPVPPLTKVAPRNLTWPVDWGEGLEMTTAVSIIPNTFPYPDCTGPACQGVLL